MAPSNEPRPLLQGWHPTPHHSTLQWHPTMAPSNGTTPTPPKLVVTLPPNHSTLQRHPSTAPCNGTSTPPIFWSPYPQTIAHYNGTLRWHPAMAPRPLLQGWHPTPHHSTLQWHPTMAPSNHTTSTPPRHTTAHHNGTEQWHHVHCTLQWHPGATSNPPK